MMIASSFVLLTLLITGVILPSVYAESANVKMTVTTDKQVYEYIVDLYGNQKAKIIVSGWIDPTTRPSNDAVQQISLYIFDENNTSLCSDWCDRTGANINTGQYQFEIIPDGDRIQPGKHYTMKTAYYNYSTIAPTIYIDDTKYKQVVKQDQEQIDALNKKRQELIDTRNNQLQVIVNNTIANPIEGKATLLILCSPASCGSWQGSVLDSNQVQQSIAGRNDYKYDFDCTGSGIYSLTVQKQTESNNLMLFVVQNGKILKSGHTVAPYGVVSLAGNCNSVLTPEFSPVIVLILVILVVSIIVILVIRKTRK